MTKPFFSISSGLASGQPDFIALAELLGEPSRAAILLELLSGRALPAGELARISGIKPQTASSHLAKLTDGGLLAVEQSGRHRYYRLASREVAQLIEAMNLLAPPRKINSLKQSQEAFRLQHARTCYDHLAGKLGVALTDRLLELGYLEATPERQFEVTETGYRQLAAFGLDMDSLLRGKRRLIRPCLDWSERRHHMAGALGSAMTERLCELGWISRYPQGRAVQLTKNGADGLLREFGFAPAILATQHSSMR
ncbi:ArsR/SmtB family transcription factor [Paenibacillus sp. CAU 1782]